MVKIQKQECAVNYRIVFLFFVLQDSMELHYSKSKVVAVTGMAFPAGEVNNFVVGSEEGNVYTASRHGRWVYLDVDFA